jgi:tetratricopeptide (TPR) repeat protein
VALAAEAVELLESEPPTPALVSAYSRLAHVVARAGAYADAVSAADRACEVAAALCLPDPAQARIFRGEVRAYLGDADGISEMERAIEVLVEQGAGWEAAVAKCNLVIVRYPLCRLAESLQGFEEAARFCEPRGLVEGLAGNESNCPLVLLELGRTDEALTRALDSAADLQANGFVNWLVEPRAVILALQLARGEVPDLQSVDWLEQAARTNGNPDDVVYALATAARAATARDRFDHACDLLDEIDRAPGTHETPYYARHLAEMVRTALAAGNRTLAVRLAEGMTARYPLDEHARCAVAAQLAEDAGDRLGAAVLYAQAATRWLEFGNVPERAFALLGQGRSLRSIRRPEAEEPLRRACELFASMGYATALLEAESLLT